MNASQIEQATGRELDARITDYLVCGGLFNPECMDPDKTRNLLMDCRKYIRATLAAKERV